MTLKITSEISSPYAGFGRVLRRSLLLLAATALPVSAQTVITQTEQDDSISTANATGLDATHTGLKIAYGNNTDGIYGFNDNGNGSGDFDFYKLGANAGQVITLDLKNNGLNDDFDSYVAIYNSAGTVVAANDDATGSGRASKLSYTVAATGTYYVCVSNWINDPFNASIESHSLPQDPFTPGTGYGPPGGTGGPYKLFIGLNATAPIIQFDGGISAGNPVPTMRWVRIPGGVGYSQAAGLALTNTGNAPYTLTAASFTGADAAKFAISSGPTLPITLAVGASTSFVITYTGNGTKSPGIATLALTSNDPLGLGYPLSVPDSNITGGGTFTVRQVNATAASTTANPVNSFTVADSLLAGTNVATTATGQYSVINFLGDGNNAGFFGNDAAFPNAANGKDSFATQSIGNIYIRKAGTYTFRGYSDDGQRLLIDGVNIIETTGANTATYGYADLTVGVHTLEYTQFEGGGGDSAELSISQNQGYYYPYSNGQTTWELVEAYSGDTDGDGLPDAWESAHGLNPNSATGADGASGDPDSDGLSNFGEYIAGTDPHVADTDGDGLLDGVENNTGVWVDATHTGTSPLIADSDGDGLLDGVENPTQASTGLSQPGTDPNKADTDGDGYGDLSEITLGSNPKLASSVPTLNYTNILADNFDGVATNSTYSFTSTSGTAPSVAATGVASNGNAARLTTAAAGNNNAIAWNQVATTSPQAIKLTFDFRFGNNVNPADGLGIGLFRTSTYGTTAPINPADGKAWENPATGGGYPDAVVLGFGVYGANVIRLAGPASPGTALVELASPFTLTSNLFNRAILTGVTNGSTGTLFSLTIIQDVNGASPTTRSIFSNVLVKNFNVATDQFRLIAGGRTGQLFTQIDLDNVQLATASTTTTTPAPTISIARTTGQPVITYTGVLQSSPDLVTFTDIAGAASPYTVPAGSPVKMFYRSRQP